MKKIQMTLMAAIVTMVLVPMTSMAEKKSRLEITTCTCDLGTAACSEVTFTSPTMDDLHAHGTREQDNGIDPACHNQVESGAISCSGPVSGIYTCTTTIDGLTEAIAGCPAEPYDDTIVVKVSADADSNHGKAKRFLKDNMVCVSEYVD
jgi:hypothetical protein